MTRPRVLVAGVGNIFLGDDAFGVARRPWPAPPRRGKTARRREGGRIMSEMTSSGQFGQPPRPAGREPSWRGGSVLPSSGLLIGGLAVAALGFLAWQYFGPDLIRYLKIRNM